MVAEISKPIVDHSPVIATDNRESVLRRIVSPRWLLFHAFTIAVVILFFRLGWWQFRRAEQGNTLSMGYALQWPLFSGFALFMWFKIVRGQPASTDAPQAAASSPASNPTLSPAEIADQNDVSRPGGTSVPSGPLSALVDENDEEVAAYNRYLARLNAQAAQQR